MNEQPYDVIETTINIDAQRKILLCWSNTPSVMKQWQRDFSSYCKLSSDGSYVEMNNLPLSEIRRIKIAPKTKSNLTDEQREARRQHGIKLGKTRVKTI